MVVSKSQPVSNVMKTKTYFIILLVGVGLIVFGLINKNNQFPDNLADTVDQDSKEDSEEESMNENMMKASFIEGILHNSDNLSRGNFKLISEEGDIYIRTSRDFDNLVGRHVLVSIDGTFENFELVDIQSKVEEDGYIISQ